MVHCNAYLQGVVPKNYPILQRKTEYLYVYHYLGTKVGVRGILQGTFLTSMLLMHSWKSQQSFVPE